MPNDDYIKRMFSKPLIDVDGGHNNTFDECHNLDGTLARLRNDHSTVIRNSSGKNCDHVIDSDNSSELRLRMISGVANQTFEKTSKKYFSGWRPPQRKDSEMGKTSMFKFRNGSKHEIDGAVGFGFDHIVDADNAEEVKYRGIMASAPGEPHIDKEVIDAFFLSLNKDKPKSREEVLEVAKKNKIGEFLSSRNIALVSFFASRFEYLLKLKWPS